MHAGTCERYLSTEGKVASLVIIVQLYQRGNFFFGLRELHTGQICKAKSNYQYRFYNSYDFWHFNAVGYNLGPSFLCLPGASSRNLAPPTHAPLIKARLTRPHTQISTSSDDESITSAGNESTDVQALRIVNNKNALSMRWIIYLLYMDFALKLLWLLHTSI